MVFYLNICTKYGYTNDCVSVMLLTAEKRSDESDPNVLLDDQEGRRLGVLQVSHGHRLEDISGCFRKIQGRYFIDVHEIHLLYSRVVL